MKTKKKKIAIQFVKSQSNKICFKIWYLCQNMQLMPKMLFYEEDILFK